MDNEQTIAHLNDSFIIIIIIIIIIWHYKGLWVFAFSAGLSKLFCP
jgi:hypothetical protein